MTTIAVKAELTWPWSIISIIIGLRIIYQYFQLNSNTTTIFRLFYIVSVLLFYTFHIILIIATILTFYYGKTVTTDILCVISLTIYTTLLAILLLNLITRLESVFQKTYYRLSKCYITWHYCFGTILLILGIITPWIHGIFIYIYLLFIYIIIIYNV